ncbi:helicase SNF [Paenibacillus campinasensis]|uniref:Helicase SNF n=2 Tax=Paenibacillus campinasensis TaxID=66347 RepID=A0A268ERR5_9BACL|nr:helicase SNF [Paenibacillus campinasensis]
MDMSGGHDPAADSMLELFSPSARPRIAAATRFDMRKVIEVEFVCRLFHGEDQRAMLGLEMRVGLKRLFTVQRLREFLVSVELGEPYEVTRHFTYDPEQHSFKAEDDKLIREMIRIHRNDSMVMEVIRGSAAARKKASGLDRMLLVTPMAWPLIQPLLAEVPAASFTDNGLLSEPLQFSSEALPVRFALDEEGDERYALRAEGLDRLIVMDSYGMALSGGKLISMETESCRRLSALKAMLESAEGSRLSIAPEQVEPFMENVIPGLMKIGQVKVGQAIADRVIKTELSARLYLDRVRGKLLAGLEFQYGHIVINPLDGHRVKRHPGSILVRDGAREQRILELMEGAGFAQTESGYFMEDEDSEFEFLYEIVPQLERLLVVYATSAVKERILPEHAVPKVSIDVDERTDWLELRFEMDGISESEIRKVIKALEEKRRYYRMPSGAFMPLTGGEFKALVDAMNRLGAWGAEVQGDRLRLPAVRGMQLMDMQDRSSSVQLGKSLRKLLANIRNPDHLDFALPPALEGVLREYQQYGFQWMKTLAAYRFGGILADDMGLGKTLQSIAYLQSVLPDIRESGQPALVVAPSSLLYNWLHEFQKFAPDMRAVVVDGALKERRSALSGPMKADVLITSYPLLRRDLSRYAGLSFHTLILDEAQAFKNYTTQTAQAVKSLQARNRFALTGTPMENRLEELWSIMDAVFPELFGGRKAFQELSPDEVARRVRPFVLRRLKSDVLKELPDKIEMTQTSELMPEQKKLYAAYLARLRQETLKHLDSDGYGKSRIRILAGLTRLRQLCCHPALFVEGYRGGSAKLEQLMETLEECRSAGRRVLVFSQFTQMLKLIGQELGDRRYPYFYLDGETEAAERMKLSTRFNEGEGDIFLISLKAGGTGLNLTGADTVILYDLWWNPAVEQQAMDRAHRIGQTKAVQVIRMVARGTLEDKMLELQQRKQHLIDEVIQSGEDRLATLTEEDIRDLLQL